MPASRARIDEDPPALDSARDEPRDTEQAELDAHLDASLRQAAEGLRGMTAAEALEDMHAHIDRWMARQA